MHPAVVAIAISATISAAVGALVGSTEVAVGSGLLGATIAIALSSGRGASE